MDTFEAIQTRRAIKSYDNSTQLTEVDFQRLMDAVILSPTSYNIQNWRLVRIKDPALRQQVQTAAWGQAQIGQAAELIVFCADLNAWQKKPERYWANASEQTRDMLIPMIHDFYYNKPQVQRDEAMRSSGIAAQTLMLAARALGYDTCPMVGFDSEALARLINLPDDHVISLVVALGKAASPAHPRGGQLPLSDVLILDRFQ